MYYYIVCNRKYQLLTKTPDNRIKRLFNFFSHIINGIICRFPICCTYDYACKACFTNISGIWIHRKCNEMTKEERELFNHCGYVPCLQCIKNKYVKETSGNHTWLLPEFFEYKTEEELEGERMGGEILCGEGCGCEGIHG